MLFLPEKSLLTKIKPRQTASGISLLTILPSTLVDWDGLLFLPLLVVKINPR